METHAFYHQDTEAETNLKLLFEKKWTINTSKSQCKYCYLYTYIYVYTMYLLVVLFLPIVFFIDLNIMAWWYSRYHCSHCKKECVCVFFQGDVDNCCYLRTVWKLLILANGVVRTTQHIFLTGSTLVQLSHIAHNNRRISRALFPRRFVPPPHPLCVLFIISAGMSVVVVTMATCLWSRCTKAFRWVFFFGWMKKAKH